MEEQAEIVSKQRIKPSSPTPLHLKHYKLCFLDQLAPKYYTPLVLFYSKPDATSFHTVSSTLKASLCDMLSLYYPFCGTIKGNTHVECNDEGVLYMEARVPTTLNKILETPQVNVLKQFLPFDPYELEEKNNNNKNEEEQVILGVQVSELSCGAIGLGLCISHTIADGTTLASLIKSWALVANKGIISGNTLITKPLMEAHLFFPPKDTHFSIQNPASDCKTNSKDVVTLRLVFDGASLTRLRGEIRGGTNDITNLDAVTGLIWKSKMKAARTSSREPKPRGFIATNVVNLRDHIEPPLPEHCIGNIVHHASTPMVGLQVDKEPELRDLVMMVGEGIRKIDAHFVRKFISDGVNKSMEAIDKGMSYLISTRIEWFLFANWTRLPFYEIDFGWGSPTWVYTIPLPMSFNNMTILMPTKCGEGIEAWMCLNEQEAVEFQRNSELLQYALVSTASF